jgi:hypothetical protein
MGKFEKTNRIPKIRQSFDRRSFIRISAMGAISAGLMFPARIYSAESKESWSKDELDQYGGLKAIKFKSSGFFRVEKKDRWWFVTPEGSAFLSFGMNHPDPDYMLQKYNLDYWGEKLGGNTRDDPKFRENFIKKVMKDLDAFGMNTIGTHARKEYYGKLTVPYIQGLFFVSNPYWKGPVARDFPDVYSDAFKMRCEKIAQNVIQPRREDPFLMGYTLTDSPVLTDNDAVAHGKDRWGGPAPEAPTWPRVLRNLGPEAPGKKTFVSIMKERYSNIEKFNDVYKSNFSSFESLLNAVDWSSIISAADVDDQKDNHAFLLNILNKYYEVAYKTIRKYDPNHLIFGDIINAQTPPPDDVVSLMVDKADLVAYQFYGWYDEQDELISRWANMTGKPLFHADSSFCVPYKEMPNPIGALCKNQEERANSFMDFATRAFQRSDFIGWNWCGWMDSWEEWRPLRQHTGLQDPFGNYHHPMPEAMSWFGERLYDFGRNKDLLEIPEF